MPDEPYPGLEIEEDLRVKRFSWVGQLVQYAVLAMVVLAGLLGVFGDGPLARAERRSGSLSVQYDRFQRAERMTVVRIDFADGGEVALDPALLEHWRVESVVPEPRSVTVDDGTIVYRFRASTSGHAAFRLTPEKMGGRSVRVESGGDAVTVAVFVYP